MSLLGERLRQARESRGISPLQVELDTRIRANVIQALEQGDFENLPPEPFLRGLIRTYANYLGADPEEMLSLYVADFTPPPPPPERPSLTRKPMDAVPAAPRSPPPPAPSPFTTPPRNVAPLPRAAPPPLTLPESLPPRKHLQPELTEEPTEGPTAPRVLLAHFTRRPASLPVVILLGLAVVFAILACGLLILSQILPGVAALADGRRTPTQARTHTPTLASSPEPSQVPTLAVTAPPFATFPGNPSPTLTITPRGAPEAGTALELDVEVTQTITILVALDDAVVFDGQMAPGTRRSWTAKESLYVRVENPKDATILFNGKPVMARVYAERNLIERQWVLNPKGTPVSTTPLPPIATPAPGSTPAQGNPPSAPPTQTLTPFAP